MTGRILTGVAAALVLAAGGLAVSDLAEGPHRPVAAAGTAADAGPQIVLRRAEMVEMRRGAEVYRLASDEVRYSILPGRMTAHRVTLTLPGKMGNVVLTAPLADWNLRGGRVEFREGGTAENSAGWFASVPEANVDLEAGVIAAGKASLAGPGFAMKGSNLRWRWREGTLTLVSPESRISPGMISPPAGSG